MFAYVMTDISGLPYCVCEENNIEELCNKLLNEGMIRISEKYTEPIIFERWLEDCTGEKYLDNRYMIQKWEMGKIIWEE